LSCATFLTIGPFVFQSPVQAVEVLQLSEANWEGAAPQGKEADAIYGDWLIRNEHIVAVIGEAIESRNANMTVRNVGGSVIDLTERGNQSDQLSAYYPLGSGYKLSGPVEKPAEGKSIKLVFRGPALDNRSTGEVEYELADNARWLKIATRITNTGNSPLTLDRVDAVRADGEFQFGDDAGTGLVWAYDPYWRQAYGALFESADVRLAVQEGERRGRPELALVTKDPKQLTLAPQATLELVRYLYPAANTVDARAIALELRGKPLVNFAISVSDPAGLIDGAEAAIKSNGKDFAHGVTDKDGKLSARLPAGNYQAIVSAHGRGEKNIEVTLPQTKPAAVELPAAGYVVAKITNAEGQPTACKVQFTGKAGTLSPNYGPPSAIHGVVNLYYSENGQFRAPLSPGEYDVIVSYGPEYDAVFTTLKVERGQDSPLTAQLKRTVDTSGWISADFHSHSTPSGDNTSSQRGRVLNLLAEHIEFAPCTEHNRLTVYDSHLEHFKAFDRMLTCPGMELTGRPLPINHQNAFPLVPKPRTQDGGGPQTDVDPVVQIERLAMWDNGAEKLVQINHPNIPQMVGDRDTNGSPDGGFEKMFSFMDVIEVHPLDNIFKKPEALPNEREQGNAIFHWLQLLNIGYRMPGVVNTDAHWNFHGSGWLRNYIKSSAEDPTKAKVADLVHTCEHGNIVMTNGPFLEVSAIADKDGDTAEVGDDLKAPGGKLNLQVRVQCPNWLEVNRVQVFVNGQPAEELNFTDRTHSAMFKRATTVFDEEIPVALDRDAHLVVACIGEGKGLGPVMGPDRGKIVPCAVGNPIFVDVDGNGFEPNGDMLGLPLVLEPGQKPSHGHKHPHD
jgi:hypothetical protein